MTDITNHCSTIRSRRRTREPRTGSRLPRGITAVGLAASIAATAMAPSQGVQDLLTLTPGDGEVLVAWDHVQGADTIRVRRDGVVIAQLPGSARSFRDTAVVEDRLHSYELETVAAGTTATVSEQLATTAVDVSPPPGPAFLFGRAVHGGLSIIYGAPAGLEGATVTYRVYVDGELAGIRTSAGANGEFSVAGLLDGAWKLVEVEVIDRLGNASRRERLELLPRDIDPPAIPVELRVDSCEDGRVTLAWSTLGGAAGDASVSYQVLRNDEVVATVHDTRATLSGLQDGVAGTYRVVGFDGAVPAAANSSGPGSPLTVLPTTTVGHVATASMSKGARRSEHTVQVGDCVVTSGPTGPEVAAPRMRFVGTPADQDGSAGWLVDFALDPDDARNIAGYRIYVDDRLARTGRAVGQPVAVGLGAAVDTIEAEFVDRDGRSSPRTALPVRRLPWHVLATPSGIASQATASGARITWDAVDGAVAYRVDVDGQTVATEVQPAYALEVPTARISSVRVTAIDANGRTSATSAPALVRAR